MKIKLTSLMVENQDAALRFYTDMLGFRKLMEVPAGEYKWISVVSPDGHPDVQLSLEPNANPAGKAYQQALFAQGIPAAAFEVDDVQAEYDRLRAKGVVFTKEPTRAGPVTIAIFSDTCGNLIQLYQPPR